MNPCTTNFANAKRDPFLCKSHADCSFVVVPTSSHIPRLPWSPWVSTVLCSTCQCCFTRPTKVSGDRKGLFVCLFLFLFFLVCSWWYLVCFDENMCKLSYWDAEHSTFQMTFKVDLWEDANLQLIYGFCKLQISNKRTLRNMDSAQ